MVGTYIKKPIPVQAVQWTGWNLQECKDFAGQHLDVQYPTLDDSVIILVLDTYEGNMVVSMGDFIIRGVEGEFYPCKPGVFAKTYIEVDEGY